MDFQVRISDPALADFEDILEYSWANFPETTQSFGNASPGLNFGASRFRLLPTGHTLK